MRARHLLLLACLAPAACGTIAPPPPTPVIPIGELGTNQDSDTAAVNFAAYTLATPARMTGNPVGVARAVASVEYLAGALYSNPHWNSVSPLIANDMRLGRDELRHTLGIPPAADPQLVVNGMLGAADALLAGNPAAAQAALNPAVFTLGPQQTLALLNRMPFQPQANIATTRLGHAFMDTGRSCFPCG